MAPWAKRRSDAMQRASVTLRTPVNMFSMWLQTERTAASSRCLPYHLATRMRCLP